VSLLQSDVQSLFRHVPGLSTEEEVPEADIAQESEGDLVREAPSITDPQDNTRLKKSPPRRSVPLAKGAGQSKGSSLLRFLGTERIKDGEVDCQKSSFPINVWPRHHFTIAA